MKWEKYEKMNQKQKDEFNFRFQYKIDFGHPIICILMFYMLIMMFMSECLALIKINEQLAMDLISNSMIIIKIIPIIFTLMLTYYLMYIILMEHRKTKWLKENGI